MNCLKIILGKDGKFLHGDNITGVKSLGHIHNGHAGFLLTVHDSALHRCGTAVLGKERHVKVHTAELGVFNNVQRKNLAVCNDENNLGLVLVKKICKSLVTESLRSVDGNIIFKGNGLHSGRSHNVSTATGLVLAGDDHRNTVTVGNKLFKTGSRNLWRTHKHNVIHHLKSFSVRA